ncbi:MAG: type 2 isopentenyl-diphosphate Delta-isomerase [Anaerolineales bacterium]|nr:type 2 isopentenyl-diphosphate Delta-isomerase [Anaerolineales bacterium]
MRKNDPTEKRKNDHIRINLEEKVDSKRTNGLECYYFNHQVAPELDLKSIDLSQTLFNRHVACPILISSMTGGTKESQKYNEILAKTAAHVGCAIGVGSQRAAIENPKAAATFNIRNFAPNVLLFSNLGAVQLNYGYGIDECRRAVDMIEADAFYLHFNALQEALQPEGNTDFSGLLKKVESICQQLEVPVIAKEVGWGFSRKAARLLKEAGVQGIDVAGAGGTSWSAVEMYRAGNSFEREVARVFSHWGIPTAESILNVRDAAPDLIIFASGGIRNGVEIAKSIALGAKLGGMAGFFIKAAHEGLEHAISSIEMIRKEIAICMFAAGIESIDKLMNPDLLTYSGDHRGH